jgi:hypothetical protein
VIVLVMASRAERDDGISPICGTVMLIAGPTCLAAGQVLIDGQWGISERVTTPLAGCQTEVP